MDQDWRKWGNSNYPWVHSEIASSATTRLNFSVKCVLLNINLFSYVCINLDKCFTPFAFLVYDLAYEMFSL